MQEEPGGKGTELVGVGTPPPPRGPPPGPAPCTPTPTPPVPHVTAAWAGLQTWSVHRGGSGPVAGLGR